jgi:hypothetical protein
MEINDIRKDTAVPAGGWLQRPVFDTRALEETVARILEDVRDGGGWRCVEIFASIR